LLVALLLITGCSGPTARQQAGAGGANVRFDAPAAQKVVDVAKTVPGVKDAAAVVMDRDILAAVRVTGFHRLRLKPIKADVGNRVQARYPGFRVEVTADKKLFVQLQTLAGQVNTGAFAPAQVEQGVKKIEKEMTE